MMLSSCPAAFRGHAAIVTILLAAGASPGSRNTDGDSPLHYAAYFGWPDVITALLDAPPTAAADLLDVDVRNEAASTPLHDAAERGHPHCVRLLLKARADVGARNERGATALHLAAEGNYAECADRLLNARSDANAVDNAGETPLARALASGQHTQEVQATLREHGGAAS